MWWGRRTVLGKLDTFIDCRHSLMTTLSLMSGQLGWCNRGRLVVWGQPQPQPQPLPRSACQLSNVVLQKRGAVIVHLDHRFTGDEQ